jgi:uncharacterized protein YbaP (TraB family)
MGTGFFRPLLAVALGAVLASGSAAARDTRPPEPALWQLSAGASKVYLFGSIHMLPRDWRWRTRAIDAAIHEADLFVFETSLTPDQVSKMRLFVRDNGTLPQGQVLSRMLSPEGLKSFTKALTMTPLDPERVNAMRPWLALMVLGDYQIQNGPLRSFVEEGVDTAIERQAKGAGKPVRHLETAESQLAILHEATPDNDIAGFEADLSDLLKVDDTYRHLLESWTAGKQPDIAKIIAGEAIRNPVEKQLLLDKRNRNWLPQIETLMVSGQTTFVTVGAAHLVGPGSVLDMLCVRGWKVERIKTGASTPPPACPAYRIGPTASLRSRQATRDRTGSFRPKAARFPPHANLCCRSRNSPRQIVRQRTGFRTPDRA